ncbi:MAG: hypothetical protein ACYCO3_16940 [Mycobacteriales bacterium]
MNFLDDNPGVLAPMVTDLRARWLSTGDVEGAFREATDELLIVGRHLG